MFNGIIQGKGILNSDIKKYNKVEIITNLNLNNINVGSSIACDGICLTIFNIKKIKKNFIIYLNVSEETFKKTNIRYWKKNKTINLEKSLKLNQEVSGHFVYGHVDYIIRIIKIIKKKNSYDFYFDTPKNLKKYIVSKGSISINGISLTINDISKNTFSVSIIPHTYKSTNLSELKVKDMVNVEIDMIARYILKK